MTHSNLTHSRVDRAAAHRTDTLTRRKAEAERAEAAQRQCNEQEHARELLERAYLRLAADEVCEQVTLEDDHLTVEVHAKQPWPWMHVFYATVFGTSAWVGMFLFTPFLIDLAGTASELSAALLLFFTIPLMWVLIVVGVVYAVGGAIRFFISLFGRSMRVRAVVSAGDRYVERLARVDVAASMRERRFFIASVLRGVNGAVVTYDPSPVRRVLGMGRKA